MIGCAIARSTSGGTGVGPGAKRYFFSIGSQSSGKKKPEPRHIRGPGGRLLKVALPRGAPRDRQSCVPTSSSRAATLVEGDWSVKQHDARPTRCGLEKQAGARAVHVVSTAR